MESIYDHEGTGKVPERRSITRGTGLRRPEERASNVRMFPCENITVRTGEKAGDSTKGGESLEVWRNENGGGEAKITAREVTPN